MPTISEHEAVALGAFQESVAAIAQVELDRLEAERDELEKALTSVKAALRSVKAVLSASVPQEQKAAKKAKAATNGSFAPSEARGDVLADWIDGLDSDTEITSILARTAFPEWSESYVNMTMKWARENGLLRKSGQSGSTILYRKLG